jgi:hypothetical protein
MPSRRSSLSLASLLLTQRKGSIGIGGDNRSQLKDGGSGLASPGGWQWRQRPRYRGVGGGGGGSGGDSPSPALILLEEDMQYVDGRLRERFNLKQASSYTEDNAIHDELMDRFGMRINDTTREWFVAVEDVLCLA